jgi:hypothetical protein
MHHFKFIKLFYLSLTVLIFIIPIKESIAYLFPGLLLMWLSYYLYSSNLNIINIKINYRINDFNFKTSFKLFLLLFYPLFYHFYIKFYTGQNIYEIFFNLTKNISNYALYQDFFKENDLNKLSLIKIPFIILNGFFKFFFLSFIFYFFNKSINNTFFDKFLILILTIVNLLVAISRGTSYEFFELFIIFITAILLGRNSSTHLSLFNKSFYLKLFFIGIFLLLYFSYNIQNRYGILFDNFINTTNFDMNSFIYLVSPSIAIALFLLYGYFIFGIKLLSIIIINLCTTVIGFISIFIPSGINLFSIELDYRTFAEKFIDIGANWVPDMAVYIDKFGLLFTFILIYFIGQLSRINFKKSKKSINSSILFFYTNLFMISLFIGDFITSNSSNLICLLLCLFFSIFNKISPFRKNILCSPGH